MKKRLNLRQKANKYKAEAEALRAELLLARKALDQARRDGFRRPATIAFNGFVDKVFLRMAAQPDIPEFTIRCRWQHGNPFGADPSYALYSARLHYESGARLDKMGLDYLRAMISRILEHWADGK